jgi:hypothetical protein
MSKKTQRFVQRLVESFPSLVPALDEHLDDNFGELLPHVFLGDVVRWIVSMSSQKGATDPGSELAVFLRELEGIFASGDNEIQELISVSFLENLPRLGEESAVIRTQLGPALAKELEVLRQSS